MADKIAPCPPNGGPPKKNWFKAMLGFTISEDGTVDLGFGLQFNPKRVCQRFKDFRENLWRRLCRALDYIKKALKEILFL